MKKTAVQFLVEQLNEIGFHTILIEKTIQQAKEMEKEQIKDAYLKNHLQGCWMKKSAEEFSEEYYNETFKSE